VNRRYQYNTDASGRREKAADWPGIGRGRIMEYQVVVDLRVFGAVLFGLFCFGVGYNAWVARLEHEGGDRGYMGFIVAVGVAVTGLGFVLIVNSLGLGLVLLACFVASGLPMIVGSVQRHVRARAREEQRAREDARGSLR